MQQAYPRAAVSVAAFRGDDVLLVQRGKAAYAGCWSLPGGSILAGEKAIEAARRELEEETGLLASKLTLGDVADVIIRDGGGAVEAQYTIVVFATEDVSGVLAADGDALDAGWFGPEARLALRSTPGLEAAVERAKRALDRSK